MTVKANPFRIIFLFSFLHSIAIAQVGYPTEADYFRKVDSFAAVLKTAKEDTNKVNTLLAVGEEVLYWSEDEQPKSLGYLKQALALSEKLRSPYHQIESLLLLSTFSSRSNDHKNGIKYAERALYLAESIKDYVKMSKCYNWLGGTYQQQGNYDAAIKAFNTSLDLAYLSGTKEALVGTYNNLAMFYMTKKPPSYPESIRHFLICLRIAEELGDIEMMRVAMNNLGYMYSHLGDYKQSLYYYNQIKTKTNFQPHLGNILASYSSAKDYKGAIEAALDYIKVCEKADNKSALSAAVFQMGLIYKEQAEEMYLNNKNNDSISYYLDKALAQFNKSEELNKNLKIKSRFYSRAFIYGETYKLKAKLALAKAGSTDSLNKYLATAFAKLSEQLNDTTPRTFPYIKAKCYVNMGEVLGMQASLASPTEKIRKYTEALKYIDTALVIGEKTLGQQATRDAYFAQADIYRQLRKYDKSFEALRKYDEVKDSLIAEESRNKFEQMRISNEIILGTTEEKARYESMIKDMRSNFLKKEDSLAFQRALAEERFIQKQKEVQLKQAELALANNQKELNLFKFLKTQAELESELVKREEKEKALTIANQEKNLQRTQLNLQETQIALKESQIQAQNRQRQFYIGGIVAMTLFFVVVYRNIRSRQKTERIVASERLRSEKAQASHQMAELELQSLRAQLNPHFMFNSLNAIQELILKEDTDNSHLYLTRFSELLRMLLDNANHAFITLKKEISLLELYLSLENLRIPDLKYSINIDPLIDSNTVNIPNMILQPYIENAIWHGLSHKKGERKLSIEIHRKGENMVCEIEDNGVGRKKAAELKSLYRREHRSKGMELLSKRFNLLSKEYGAAIQTTIEDLYNNDTPSGTKVMISIPFSLMEQNNGINSST